MHELVEPSLNRLGVKIRKCNAPVHHYGKLVEDKVISKGETYYDLGKVKLKENEAFCLTCKEPVEILDLVHEEINKLYYLTCICGYCGRKISKIINRKFDK